MAIDRTPPRFLDLITSGQWPHIARSKPEMPLKKLDADQGGLENLGLNYALALRDLGAKKNPAVRKKIIAWVTAEALDHGPYANLPESAKEELRKKISDLLFSAPNILA